MKLKSLLPLLIAIAALICLPLFVHNPYYIHLVETILIYTILLYGLDIVVGYVGQVSLGHAALFVHRRRFVLPLWLDDLGNDSCVHRRDLDLWRYLGVASTQSDWTLFGDGDIGLWNHCTDSD